MMAMVGRHGMQHEQQRRRQRHRHLSEIAGEVVGAERLERAWPRECVRDERRRQRVLRARADPAENQRNQQNAEPRADPGQHVAEAGERGSADQYARCADPLGDQRCGTWNAAIVPA